MARARRQASCGWRVERIERLPDCPLRRLSRHREPVCSKSDAQADDPGTATSQGRQEEAEDGV
jgi:hypothetical protein